MGLKRGWVKKIFSEFKKELPDIVKDFPKLPRLFKNFLQNSEV